MERGGSVCPEARAGAAEPLRAGTQCRRHQTAAGGIFMRVLTVALGHEYDVVLARQRPRQVAALLAFDMQDQTRLAPAVSEIAHNAVNFLAAIPARVAVGIL